MSIFTIALLFLATLVLFVVVDAIWLTLVTAPEFRRILGDTLRANPDMVAAVVFYLFYAGLIVGLAVVPSLTSGGGLAEAALRGAVIALIGYGTYELTNMATIEGWTWHMVLLDTAWGLALTAGTATAVVFGARLLGAGSSGG